MNRKKLRPMPIGKTDSTESEMPKKIQLRYSDEDLVFFKGLLLEKLAVAQTEFKNLTSGLRVEKDGPEDQGEEGQHALSKEEASQLAQRQKKFIRCIEAALIRTENGTYGICRETGNLIPRERLMIVPHATMCAEAKKDRDK